VAIKNDKYLIGMNKQSFKDFKAVMRRQEETFDKLDPRFNGVRVDYWDKLPARSDGTYETYLLNLDTWQAYAEKNHFWTKTKVCNLLPRQEVIVQRMFLWQAIACNNRRMNGKIFGYAKLID